MLIIPVCILTSYFVGNILTFLKQSEILHLHVVVVYHCHALHARNVVACFLHQWAGICIKVRLLAGFTAK